MAFFGLFGKEKKETLDKGLEKTKESVLSKIGRAIAGKSTVDDDVLEQAWREEAGDADLEIIAEHLMIYFLFTYFCGAVYDEEAHSKMKFSIIGTLMVLETAKVLWEEDGRGSKMAAILEAAKRYSREVEHSDENIELLEKLSRRESVFGLDGLMTGILN